MKKKVFEYIDDYLWGTQISSPNWSEFLLEQKVIDEYIRFTKNHTKKEYNVFSLPSVNLIKIYKELKEVIGPKLNTEYSYVIKSSYNFINTSTVFKDWKKPWEKEYEVFTGFICIKIEPCESYMIYKLLPDEKIEYKVALRNNLCVFGRSYKDIHMPTPWLSDSPRITISFDIIPVHNLYLIHKGKTQEELYKKLSKQHYIPF